MIDKKDQDWFSALKVGDEVAVRRYGIHGDAWRYATVASRTSKGIRLDHPYAGGLITAVSRNFIVRPWTPEDAARAQSLKDSRAVRAWVESVIKPIGWGDAEQPIEPQLLAELLPVMARHKSRMKEST